MSHLGAHQNDRSFGAEDNNECLSMSPLRGAPEQLLTCWRNFDTDLENIYFTSGIFGVGHSSTTIRNEELDGVENQAVGNGDDGRRISPVGDPHIDGNPRGLEATMNRS